MSVVRAEWIKGRETRAAEALTRLERIVQSSTNPNVLPFQHYFAHTADVRILARAFTLKGVESFETHKVILGRALDRYWRSKRRGLGPLKARLATTVRQYNTQPELKWRVVLPVNVPSNAWGAKRSLRSGELRFHLRRTQSAAAVRSWREKINRHYPRDDVLFGDHFTRLVTEVLARDMHEAFEQAQHRHRLLLAALNFKHTVGQLTVAFQGRPRPLAAAVSGPNYVIYDHQGGLACVYYREDPPEQYSPFLLKPHDVSAAESLLKYFRRVESRSFTGGFITQTFGRYQEAIDAAQPREAFLRLWQVLDAVTHPDLSESEGSYNVQNVRSRAALFLDDARMHGILEESLKLRNALVHRGTFNGDLTDVSFLKLIVEEVLLKFMRLEPSCPDVNGLLTYFKSANSGDAILNSQIRTLAAIRKRRSKSSRKK